MIHLTLEEQERRAYMAGDTERAALCGDLLDAGNAAEEREAAEELEDELRDAEGIIAVLEDALRDARRDNSRLREEQEALS